MSSTPWVLIISSRRGRVWKYEAVQIAATILSLLWTFGGRFGLSLCRHMCASMIHAPVHAICTFLILAEYRLCPFSSPWLARRALLIAHKKIRGVFSRTVCCFPWCRLSFSASLFLGDETERKDASPRRHLLGFMAAVGNHSNSENC